MGQNMSDCGSCRNKDSNENMFGVQSTNSNNYRLDYITVKQNSDYFCKKKRKRRRRKRNNLFKKLH